MGTATGQQVRTCPVSYGPAGYGPGGPGAAGYSAFGGGPDDKRRARRRTVLIAGASAVAAAALTVAGFGAANAFGSTTLTSAQIAQKVDPGLVDIVTNLGYQQGQAAGTGMVLTSSGEVLTNNHVIRGATQIKATDVGNGRSYTAKVVGYDEKDDVAVLQLQGASGLQTVSPSSASVSVGDKVVALGNAAGQGRHPVQGHRQGHRARPDDHCVRRGLQHVRAAQRHDPDQRADPAR